MTPHNERENHRKHYSIEGGKGRFHDYWRYIQTQRAETNNRLLAQYTLDRIVKQCVLTSHRISYADRCARFKTSKKKSLPQKMSAFVFVCPNVERETWSLFKVSRLPVVVLLSLSFSLWWRLLQTFSHSCALTWVILAHSPTPLDLTAAVTRPRCFSAAQLAQVAYSTIHHRLELSWHVFIYVLPGSLHDA